jgi:hypothetical protein
MGLLSVQVPNRAPRSKSTLEQVAEGVDIASKILGKGIEAYKVFGIDKPQSESNIAYQKAHENYMNAQTAMQPASLGYMNASPTEIKQGRSHMISGYDQPVVPKNELSMESAGLRITTGADDKQEKDAENLTKHLDVSVASSRSPLGKSANNYYAAQRIQTLLQPYEGKEDTLTPQQVYELARSTDAMLSQTGATVAGTEHLLPKSALGDFSTWSNYLKNTPGGANMGQWVRNLSETAKREGGLAADQVNAKLDAVAKGSEGGRLAKTNPERYNKLVEAYRNSLLNLNNPVPKDPHTSLETAQKYDSDVVDYATKHGITPDQALQLKQQRMGQ